MFRKKFSYRWKEFRFSTYNKFNWLTYLHYEDSDLQEISQKFVDYYGTRNFRLDPTLEIFDNYTNKKSKYLIYLITKLLIRFNIKKYYYFNIINLTILI